MLVERRITKKLHRCGFLLLLTGLLLSGCGSNAVAPVSDRSHAPIPPKTYLSPSDGTYRVRPGDTLYAIAWRYGKDFRGLARANGIGGDYRIYPGQRLKLEEAPESAASPVARPRRVVVKAAPGNSPEPGQTSVVSTPEPVKKAAPAARASASSMPPGPLEWRWPANGPVLAGFSTRGKINKGVNIGGNPGDPVFAAAPGEVVYAGSGLLGYGNLIIINHNEQFLSAYAHNSKLLAKERDRVKTGDKIAEIGNSGAAQTMLHFEIRKDGTPVNPLRYLPKK